MPGISLIINDKKIDSKKDKISAVLKNQNYLENYYDKVIASENDFFIGYNKYEQYPVKVLSTNNSLIVIEGKIYNKREPVSESEIINLANVLFEEESIAKLSEWIQSTDGDFLVYIINKISGDFIVFNDIFGRLPLYYKKCNDGSIITSRYLNFINELSDETTIDQMAIAQFLLFGYMLNDRTIHKDVHQLRPSSILLYRNKSITLKNTHVFNFQQRVHSNKSKNENIANLNKLFSDSCKNRFLNDKKNIVTLSGGLDSRLVASSIYSNKIPFSVVTIKYKYGSAIKDMGIALKLADIFNVDSHVIDVKPSNGNEVYTLLKLKEGMNSLFTARILSFYQEIKNLFGNDINFITGDNGDKLIFTYDKKIKHLSSLDELADYIVTEHSIFEIETVSKLTSVSTTEILDELKILLRSFPETEFKEKYVHYRAIERPHKFAFQGEDRHRHYFWTMSPFWSYPFFNYIMNCSDESKKRHKLFAPLIGSFSKEAINQPYSNFKSSVTSIKGKIFMFLVFYFYSIVPNKIRVMFKSFYMGWNPKINIDSNIMQCIKLQFTNSKYISKYLMINDFSLIARLRKAMLYIVLTITSTIELLYDKESTIKKFSDKEFN
jgi:asparagine synthase (glutamine-hydrolysing)